MPEARTRGVEYIARLFQAWRQPRRPPHRLATAPPRPRRSSRIAPNGKAMPAASPPRPASGPPPPSPRVARTPPPPSPPPPLPTPKRRPTAAPEGRRTRARASTCDEEAAAAEAAAAAQAAAETAAAAQASSSSAAHSYAAGCTFFAVALQGAVREGHPLNANDGQRLARDLRMAAGAHRGGAGHGNGRCQVRAKQRNHLTPQVHEVTRRANTSCGLATVCCLEHERALNPDAVPLLSCCCRIADLLPPADLESQRRVRRRPAPRLCPSRACDSPRREGLLGER